LSFHSCGQFGFIGREHLSSLQSEAKHLIGRVFDKGAAC
jgi:hypothetical protein